LKPALIFLFFCLMYAFPSGGQTNPFTIKTNNPEPVQYCKDSVLIADKLIIEGNPNPTLVKISISEGYLSDQDELVYNSPDGKIKGTWSVQQGFLTLTGSTDFKEYEAAIRLIRYNNKSSNPKTGNRKITISLDDVDFLPTTGHFYRFISKPGIKWSVAKAEAESDSMKYNGLRGYLATITSAEENSFIQTKTKSVGWIGASDSISEGKWRWVTGPEGLKDSLFWIGTGAQYKAKLAGSGPVNGAYNNWNCNKKYSEPNNSGGHESYAHITIFPKDTTYSYYWNDLPDKGGTGDYYPAGYLIEFGGMPGDPVLDLTTTVELHVNTITFDPLREFTICAGDSVQLNRKDIIPTWIWAPSEKLSSASVSNPWASPLTSTRFLATATNGICVDTDSFKVNVNPLPVSLLNPEENICKGTNITLNPGIHSSYLWSNDSTKSSIEVSAAGDYSVELKTSAGCKLTSTVKVVVHEYPVINISALDTLICGSKSTAVNITSNAENYALTSPDNRVQISGLDVNVTEYGSYPFRYQAIDKYCVSDTTLKIGFHKIPTVSFSIDSTKCYRYNLTANYVGDTNIPSSRFTWVFGGDTIADGKGIDSNVIPLGVNKSKRDLLLKVTDEGCSDSYTIQNIKVIPDLTVQVVDSIGCEPFKAEFMAQNSESVTYDWDYGDGITERLDNHPFHTYKEDGFYNLKLKVTTDKGCTNSVSVDSIVYVAPIPTVGFNLDPALCLDQKNHGISYVGSGDDKDTYNWDLSAFDSSEIIGNPGTTQGPFTFNLRNKPMAPIGLQVVSKYGCKSEIGKIEVKRKPFFSFTVDRNLGCVPLETNFSSIAGDPVDQINYAWDFGDGTVGSGKETPHLYSDPDKHFSITLSGLSDLTGCSDTISKDTLVYVAPIPTLGFSLDPSVCLDKKDQEVSYSGSGDEKDTYNWDLSAFDSSEIIRNPGTTQGPFTFNLINKPKAPIGLQVVSKYGCKSEIGRIEVKRKPSFSFTVTGDKGCVPLESAFLAAAGDPVDQINYTWNFGDGTSGTGNVISHLYNDVNKKYDVTLSGASAVTGCSDILTEDTLVFVYPKPKAEFIMDHSIVYNDKPDVRFENQSQEATHYQWDFGDGGTSADIHPEYKFKGHGYRKVLLESFNDYQCSDTISHQVLVALSRIFPPNAFSPNAPNEVDREFKLNQDAIKEEGYHLVILSRWDDIVFETRNEIKGWDGKLKNGDYAPAGSYVWVLDFIDFLGRKHRQSGTVTLVY